MAEGNPYLKVGSKWQRKTEEDRKFHGEATIVAFGVKNLIYSRDGEEFTWNIPQFLHHNEPVPMKHYLWKELGGNFVISTYKEWPKGSYADQHYKYMGEVLDYQG